MKKYLAVEKIGKLRWRLVRSFSMYGVKVPKGFETDLATAVRTWARDADEAAVIHDYMCTYPDMWTRKEADHMFLKVMLSTSVHPLKAKIMFMAVRVYGIIILLSRGIQDALRRT